MFKFDVKTAKESEVSGYSRIEESGAYDVTIKQAYVTRGAAPKLSEALTMEIVTDSGAEGRVFLWYQKADGTPNEYAIAAVNATMGVLKMRELEKSTGLIEVFDYEQKKPTTKEGEVFAALKGKKLKMSIQAKWDSYNGKTRAQLELKCPATTEGFTVSEVLDGSTKPEMFQRAIDRLKPIGPKPEAQQPETYQAPTATAFTATDFEDGVPF